MLMYSFRFNRKLRRSTLLILLLLTVMAAGRVVLNLLPGGAVETSVPIRREYAKTEEQRQQFISSLGWQTEPQPAEAIEVVIPKKFDETYLKYNEIQKQQGLDLSRYAKKTLTRYTYTVTNYEGYEGTVYINLLQHRDRIVGCDICSADPAGFVSPLKMEE